MGGGQLGYQWFFIKDSDYNNISGATRFIRPVDLGIFSPTPNTGRPTTHSGADSFPFIVTDIAANKFTYDELIHQYNECQVVEVALRKQIIEAIDG